MANAKLEKQIAMPGKGGKKNSGVTCGPGNTGQYRVGTMLVTWKRGDDCSKSSSGKKAKGKAMQR